MHARLTYFALGFRQRVLWCRGGWHDSLQVGDLSLTVARSVVDPAYYVRTSPVLPRHIMLRAWSTAASNAVTGSWRAAQGPASAAAMTLKEVGWKMDALKPFNWTTGSGDTLHVLDMAPGEVVMRLEADIERQLWRSMAGSSTVFRDFDGQPWLKPVKSLLQVRDKPSWGPCEKRHAAILGVDRPLASGSPASVRIRDQWALPVRGTGDVIPCVMGMPDHGRRPAPGGAI